MDICRTAASNQNSGNSEQPLATKAEMATMLMDEIKREEARYRLATGALFSIYNPKIKSVLEYHYLCGMTIKEIAKELHYSLDSIKRYHRNGLAMIEEHLGAHHIGENG